MNNYIIVNRNILERIHELQEIRDREHKLGHHKSALIYENTILELKRRTIKNRFMIINTHNEFVEFIQSDRHLHSFIRSGFASNYEHLFDTAPMITLNELAADYTWDDLISNAFTEDVEFNNPVSEAKEYLIQKFGFTYALVQSGF